MASTNLNTWPANFDPALAPPPQPQSQAPQPALPTTTTSSSQSFGTTAELCIQILAHSMELIKTIDLPDRGPTTKEALSIDVTRLPQRHIGGMDIGDGRLQYVAIVNVHVASLPLQPGDMMFRYDAGFIQGRTAESKKAALEGLLDATCEMMHDLYVRKGMYVQPLSSAQHLAASGGCWWDGGPRGAGP